MRWQHPQKLHSATSVAICPRSETPVIEVVIQERLQPADHNNTLSVKENLCCARELHGLIMSLLRLETGSISLQ